MNRSNMKKIPFHIISGFLGSGKTTFLKRIIDKYASEYKIGIIQNEFAPSNIDGVELKQAGNNFHLLEINSGSVFCVCLLGDFVRSLEKFIDEYHPDILIIEASGLSDTTSVTEVISSGTLSQKIFLASNWCIVDAQNFEKIGAMKQRIVHQIRMADIVLINKTDLAKNGIENLNSEIKKINPFAQIIEAKYCDVDFEMGTLALNKFYFKPWKALPRPEINSMVIKTGKRISERSLKDFLNKWAPLAFRIKGFVNLTDGMTVAVQCTFENIEIKLVSPAFSPTELVALTDKFTLRQWNQSFKKFVF
jgi:G3E family GTPase